MTQPVSLAVRSFEDLTSVEEPSLYTPAAPIQPGKEQAVAARVEVFWDEAETAAVEIVSPAIFGDPRGAEARAFYARVFAAAEVESVLVDASQGRAEIRFHPEGDDPRRNLKALAAAFRKVDASGAQAATVAEYLGRDPELQLFRHGNWISTWAVKHEIPGRIRLHNPALFRAGSCVSQSRAN